MGKTDVERHRADMTIANSAPGARDKGGCRGRRWRTRRHASALHPIAAFHPFPVLTLVAKVIKALLERASVILRCTAHVSQLGPRLSP